MEHHTNKAIVAQFYKQVIGGRDASLIPALVREDYIQHSAAGKDGRQGLVEMVEFLKTLPAASPLAKSPIKMLLGDGDLVAGLMDIQFMGKRMLVIDLFRFQDGMLAEHWDAVQEVSEGFVLDEIEINVNAEVAANKMLVAQMPDSNFRRIIGEGDVVVTQSELLDEGKRLASYDIFRIADGLATKLLNIRQEIPEVMMHDNGMV